MIHDRRVVGLVPIKAHSARVVGKNFRPFCGKPLYQHVLQMLCGVPAIDMVIVDTDSEVIKREVPGLSSKIRVISRPKHLRGDDVSTNRIFAHDIAEAGLDVGDILVQTHVTNPLLRAETVTNAIKGYVEKEGDDCDSTFSVTVRQSRYYRCDGTPVNHDPDELIPTQELDPLMEENSCLYLFTPDSFKRTGRRIGERPHMFETGIMESFDIDNEIDFRLAEIVGMWANMTPA